MRISPAGKRYTVHTGHTFHACLRIVLLNLALLILMANGMTKQPLRADVYHRENCIAPDIVFIVWTTNTKRARARARVALGLDGRM